MKALKLINSFSYPKNVKTTLCKLSENNNLFSRYLCCMINYFMYLVQYNDINDIQKEYIDIWNAKAEDNFITLESFNKHFHLENYPILEQYFSYCSIYLMLKEIFLL